MKKIILVALALFVLVGAILLFFLFINSDNNTQITVAVEDQLDLQGDIYIKAKVPDGGSEFLALVNGTTFKNQRDITISTSYKFNRDSALFLEFITDEGEVFTTFLVPYISTDKSSISVKITLYQEGSDLKADIQTENTLSDDRFTEVINDY